MATRLPESDERVIGWEDERGAVARLNGKAITGNQLYTILKDIIKLYDGMLPWGARQYIDVGNHPEYSIGEVRCPPQDHIAEYGARQVPIASLGGERLLNGLLSRYLKIWHRMHPGDKLEIQFYRGNVCGFGSEESAYGSHANFQIYWDGSLQEFYEELIGFLVAAQLVFGTGRVRSCYDGKSYFEISQRSGFIERVYSSYTTQNRPIANLRDWPYAGDGSKRLHVINFDNPFDPDIHELLIGVMLVLIRMREERKLYGLNLADPVAAIREISRNPGAKLCRASGGTVTALGILEHYAEQALKFEGYNGGPIGRLVWHLSRLRQSLDPFDHKDELQWAAKQCAVLERLDEDPTAGVHTLQAIDLSFQNITATNSRRAGYITEEDKNEADATLRSPSPDTRAAARGRLIQAIKRKGFTVDYSSRWDKLWVSDKGPDGTRDLGYVVLPNPLDSTLKSAKMRPGLHRLLKL